MKSQTWVCKCGMGWSDWDIECSRCGQKKKDWKGDLKLERWSPKQLMESSFLTGGKE